MSKHSTKLIFISDVSKLLGVESHVLRYWEEELKLPIKRNDMGHRCYSEHDITQFRRILDLKREGMQLRAIRFAINDKPDEKSADSKSGNAFVASKSPAVQTASVNKPEEITEDKSKRLQYLLRTMISDAVRSAVTENNAVLAEQVKASVVKELDYQFRLKEEHDEASRQEELNKQQEMLNAHFKKIDDALRLKQINGKAKKSLFRKREKNPGQAAVMAMQNALGD